MKSLRRLNIRLSSISAHLHTEPFIHKRYANDWRASHRQIGAHTPISTSKFLMLKVKGFDAAGGTKSWRTAVAQLSTIAAVYY
jgi:hypothetical protein